MLSSAPAMALLPPRCPVDPGVGLWNWPPMPMPSGPTIRLPGPIDGLLHDVIFHQPHVPADFMPTVNLSILSAHMVIERIETAPVKAQSSTEMRVIDVSATSVDSTPLAPTVPLVATVDRVDPLTAEVTRDEGPRVEPQPSVSPLSSSSDVSEFSYANTRMAALDKPTRSAFTLSVARLMDSTLLYFRGECDEATFAQAHMAFFKAIQIATGHEPQGKWPLPKNQRHSPPSQQLRNQQSTQAMTTKGQRLAKLLKEWLNLDCIPTSDTYTHGQYRYMLRPWYGIGCDGLFVELEAPDGRSWIRSKIAFSPNDLQARIREINEEYERRVALGNIDTLESRISARTNSLRQQAAKNATTVARKTFLGEPIGDQNASGTNA